MNVNLHLILKIYFTEKCLYQFGSEFLHLITLAFKDIIIYLEESPLQLGMFTHASEFNAKADMNP